MADDDEPTVEPQCRSVRLAGLEIRARELSPTALIKHVEIEEKYVLAGGSANSRSSSATNRRANQIDRTYHITISTDAADDTPAHQETVRFLTTDVMRSFNQSTMADDNYSTSQSNLNESTAARRRQRSTDRSDELAAMEAEQAHLQQQQHQQQQQVPVRTTRVADEMSQDLQFLSREAPLDGGESTFGAYSTLGGSQLHVQQPGGERTPTPATATGPMTTSELDLSAGQQQQQQRLEADYERADFRIDGDDETTNYDQTTTTARRTPLQVGAEQLERQQRTSAQQLEQLAPDNVDIQRPLQQAGLGPFTTMDNDEPAGGQGQGEEKLLLDGDDDEEQRRRREIQLGELDNAPQVAGRSSGALERATPGEAERPIGEDAPPPLVDLAASPAGDQTAPSRSANSRPAASQPWKVDRLKPFLVSFMVDARGGAMRGCRHSGVRVIIPPNSAPQPMRITCRYLRRERLVHPPPLMEGEACASKIMEVGPAGARFLGPVLIEVPHFASLRGKEREIIILRSDSGEVWREHLVEADDQLIESIIRSAEMVEQQQADQENQRPPSGLGAISDGGGGGDSQQQQEKRLTRIVTNEFPQYFAIISRIRQEVHTIGPDGSVVDSQVVPRVQAIFTDGALTKRIKIGLQKKNAESPDLVQDDSQTQTSQDQERARSPSAGRPGSSAGKRKSRFLACFGASHGSHEFGLDQATDGELGFASGSNDDSPSSSTGGDSPRQYGANGKLIVGGGPRHRQQHDATDSEGDSLTLTRQSRRGPLRRRSLAGELVPEDYYMEQEPPLILNVEPTTYGKRMASSSAQTDPKLQVNGFMTTSTRDNKAKRRGMTLLSGGRRSRSKTQMQIPFHEPLASGNKNQSSQGKQKRPKSTDPGASSTAYSSLESNNNENDQQQQQQQQKTEAELLDEHMRSSLSDLSEGNQLAQHSKFRTCTIQTDSDSVTVQYVTISALPQEAAGKVLSATTTTGHADDGYVSGSGDAKRGASHLRRHEQQLAEPSAGKKSGGGLFSPFCVSTPKEDELTEEDGQAVNGVGVRDEESSKRDRKQRKADKKKAKQRRADGSLEIVRESAAGSAGASPEPATLEEKSARATSPSKLVETITTTTTTTMSQSFEEEPLTSDGGGEEADESLLTSTRSTSPTTGDGGSKKKKEKKQKSKAEKQEKLRLKELERQKQRELEAAEKARKKAEKEAKKEAERLEKLAKKGSPASSRAQSPVAGAAEQQQRQSSVEATDEETTNKSGKSAGGSGALTTITKTIQNVKFAPSPNKERREPDEVVVEETTTTTTTTTTAEGRAPEPSDESTLEEPTSESKSKSSKSKFKIKLPKLSLGGGGKAATEAEPEKAAAGEEPAQVAAGPDEDNSLVHISIGDATLPAEQKHSSENELEFKVQEPVESSTLVESYKTTSSHVQTDARVPLKPILKQTTSIESTDEPRSIESMADRIVTSATEEAVQKLGSNAAVAVAESGDEPITSTKVTSEISTTNFRTSSEASSTTSDSKKELARRAKAEKERQRAEQKQLKLEQKARREEEKRLLKEAERAAKKAEEAAKRAGQEAREASEEAERQAKIAREESERAIREIEEEQSQRSEQDEKTLAKQAKREKKKFKKAKPSSREESELEVQKETKTETTEFFLKGEEVDDEPQVDSAGQVISSSSGESAEKQEGTPSSSTSKKISLGLPKISLDLGRKKRQSSEDQDEKPPAQVEETVESQVVAEPKLDSEAHPAEVATAEEPEGPTEEPAGEPAAPPSPSPKKARRVKPRGCRMNCFRARKPKGSATSSAEDLTKAQAEAQQEAESASKEGGKMKARSKLDKEARKQKKLRKQKRSSATEEATPAEGQEAEAPKEPSERQAKRGFISRIFRSGGTKAKTLPSEREVTIVSETSQFDLDGPEGGQKREQQIVSEMYPSDPDNADGEMILEVNVPHDLIQKQQQQQQSTTTTTAGDQTTTIETVTTTTHFLTDQQQQQQQQSEDISSPTKESSSQPAQVQPSSPTTITATETTTTEDQEATLVNVSQVPDYEDDEATENVVSQSHDLAQVRDESATIVIEDQSGAGDTIQVPSGAKFEPRSQADEQKSLESPSKLESQQVAAEEQPEESTVVTREVIEQVENLASSSPASQSDAKQEKARKELEAKLEKEAKKRAKEDEKLRLKREKEEKKLAALEAKRSAKEEKERLKREAKEAKRLAELAKKEAKRGKKKSKAGSGEPEVVAAQASSEVNAQEQQQQQPTTITTTTVTTTSTTEGDERALNPQMSAEGLSQDGQRVLICTSGEVPVNEETEVERTVEEVVGEDGTMTKTTKVVETKYVTMRQEEVRLAERRDIPAEEWERIQAERGAAHLSSSSSPLQAGPSTSGGATLGQEHEGGDVIETYRKRTHYIVREPLVYPTPELDEIKATPSYFDPERLPEEIKATSSIAKQLRKRIKLNQRIIKRANKLSRSEAKKAKRDQRRAESEIAVCDCAAQQARKELKRALAEAKKAVKEAEKRHKKMDKVDKKIAKRQKKLEKRQKKIDKKLAKLAKKQAKNQAKLEKKQAKELKRSSSSSSRSSKRSKSIKLEDIGAPVLRSSSRADMQASGSQSGGLERHLIITDEGTRRISRPTSMAASSTGGGHEFVQQRSGSSQSQAEVPVSLELDEPEESSATLHQQQRHNQSLTQEQIEQQVAEGKHELVHTITREITTEGEQDDEAALESVEKTREVLTGPDAEEAAMRMELEASREEDEQVIDVVGGLEDDEEQPGDGQQSVQAAQGEDQENEEPQDEAAGQEQEVEPEQEADSSSTPSKKSGKRKNKKKKQKSTESAE